MGLEGQRIDHCKAAHPSLGGSAFRGFSFVFCRWENPMIIHTDVAINKSAANHPEPDFCILLSRLLIAISCGGDFDPTELVRLAVIEPGDTLETVTAELGYTLTPDWEARDREGGWYALTYILSDWGEGIIVLLPDRPDIDPAILHLCSETPETR